MSNEADLDNFFNSIPKDGNEIEEFAILIKMRMDDGVADPLEIHVNFKKVEALFDLLTSDDDYTADVRNSAELYGKEFKKYGANIKQIEAGTNYDYSKCDHKKYIEICKQIKELDKEKKRYENLFRNIKESAIIEDCKVYPPKKSSTSTVKISFE